jgi:hypothetical protein
MALTDQAISTRLMTMRIIVGALLMGLATFAGVAVFLNSNSPTPPPQEGPPLLTYLALGVVAVCGTLSFVLPTLLGPNLVKQAVLQQGGDPSSALLMAYQTLLIISCALCEGPGFLCLIAYIVEKQPLALLGAAAAGVLIALRFPTLDGVRLFINRYTRG